MRVRRDRTRFFTCTLLCTSVENGRADERPVIEDLSCSESKGGLANRRGVHVRIGGRWSEGCRLFCLSAAPGAGTGSEARTATASGAPYACKDDLVVRAVAASDGATTGSGRRACTMMQRSRTASRCIVSCTRTHSHLGGGHGHNRGSARKPSTCSPSRSSTQ